MGVLARWTIRPRLMGVPGVANVAIWGQRERQLQVQVDPQRLADKGVALSQVVSTAGNSLWVSSLSFLEASTPGTGGFFDAPNQRLAVRHVSPIIAPTDLAGVPLESADEHPAPTGPDGAPLRLGDVANVVEDHQPLIGDAIVDGKPGLMLVVEKLPDAHTLDVTKGVEAALADLKPGLTGLTIDSSIFRPAGFIHHAVHDLGITLLIGFGLLLLALALLFYHWRTALVAVTGIVTSLVAAAFVLELRGSTINTLVVAGLAIALGVVIDDAILVAESVPAAAGRRRQDEGPPNIAAEILDVTAGVRRALIFATLIVLLPLLPVYFLSGLGRAFGRPLAFSYALALLTSMVVAMTVTPALAVAVFSRAPLTRRESPFLRWVGQRYNRLLLRGTRSFRPAYLTVAALAVVGILVVPHLSQSPIPTFKETDFRVDLDGAPGTSLPEMDRITERMSNELRAIPGVRDVGGQVGRAVTSRPHLQPQLGGAVGERQGQGELRLDGRRHQDGGPRVPRDRHRPDDLLGGADPGGRGRQRRSRRRAPLRPGPRHPPPQGGRRAEGPGRHQGPRQPPRRPAHPGADRCRWRSTSRRPRRPGSSRATCAGRRPRCCRECRSATSSRSRRCSTWWCGAHRPSART